MLFNSLTFLWFFIIVYSLYLVIEHRGQNKMLVVASCIFYGAWDWRFLGLMFVSITTDYLCSKFIYASNDKKVRKRFLFLSLFVNLFILGFFKYFNFFSANLKLLLGNLGFNVNIGILNVILPIGVSFYTFEAMSYIMDIYRNELKPAKNYWDYVLFVTYFPHLIAGPIMRAKDFLPQIENPRKLSMGQFYEGCHLILWGLFQKIFVADNLARIADPVFSSAPPYDGIRVLIAVYAFAFQIYCDFAGYSNIARGLGKCMGFDIMVNFNLPYFATNPKEFWQRWHISLSRWLRNYLYIPLGGNKSGTIMTYRNLALTMVIGGLWHGAAWTFVAWGIYQGLLLVVHRLCEPFLKKIPTPRNPVIQNIWFAVRVFFFFNLVCIGWLLFRAQSLTQAWQMFQSLFSGLQYIPVNEVSAMAINFLFFVWLLVVVQMVQFWKNNLLAVHESWPIAKYAFYYVCINLMVIYGVTSAQPFIYFQF